MSQGLQQAILHRWCLEIIRYTLDRHSQSAIYCSYEILYVLPENFEAGRDHDITYQFMV